MSLRINHNVQAMNAHRQLSSTSASLSKAMERLSSGYRINRASDDAAGLGISEKMRGQIRGLAQAQRNMQDGISLVQTAEANLDEVHSMLQRMRELAVQYHNGTMSGANQSAIQSEVFQLASEIDRIGQQAQFNGITFLAIGGTVSFQVGANDGQVITVATISLGSTLPTGYYDLSLSTSISNLDAAIDSISATRSTFGAVQNRLEHSANAASAYQENLVAAESRIRDVDMAEQMIEFTKLQVLQQAGTSMLAQANQSTQGVLSLLQG
ncbi:MAG TPA: flagellin, partial [Solirubrobacterales bacterium]|nr:flagellin [Solirubrobacterales bacterium]